MLCDFKGERFRSKLGVLTILCSRHEYNLIYKNPGEALLTFIRASRDPKVKDQLKVAQSIR